MNEQNATLEDFVFGETVHHFEHQNPFAVGFGSCCCSCSSSAAVFVAEPNLN